MFASKLWRTQSSKIRYVCYNAPSNSHAGQPVFDWKITPPLRQLFVQIDELQAFTARNWNLTETLPTWMRLQLTYSTLALEGSTLTLNDIVALEETGLTVAGKSLKDYDNLRNHYKALQTSVTLARQRQHLTEDTIKGLHHTLFPEDGGKYKSTPEATLVKTILQNESVWQVYVLSEFVEQQMKELVEWIQNNEEKQHPVFCSAVVHYNIARIHPFSEGNGKLARLIGNLILFRSNYTPIAIYPQDGISYSRALLESHQENELTPFMEFVAQKMYETQRELLELTTINL